MKQAAPIIQQCFITAFLVDVTPEKVTWKDDVDLRISPYALRDIGFSYLEMVIHGILN